tara:strand:+ start:1921 stop:2571 length:651 start_codon:yes stop_codon:yes gene_type:complete
MNNIQVKTLKIKFFTILFILFSACSVYAFGLGDLMGGGDKGPDLTGTQTELTGNLKDALINLGKSQQLMAKAMGLDEQAMAAGKMVEGLKAGDLGAKDDVEKTIQTAASVQDAIAKKSAEKEVLGAESKAVFVSSVPFYIKGGVGTFQTGKKAVEAGQSLASAGPMALLKLGPLVAIVAELPGLVSKLGSSTKQIIDFMTANDIPTDKMSKLTTDY